MNRALKPFAAVLAILALVLGLALAFRSNGNSNKHPSESALEQELVCTTCHEPLDESTSPLAMQMKAQIRKQIAAGRTKTQIEDYFVAELGPQVLAVPRSSGFDLLAWLLPFGAILFGAGAVGLGARAWLRERPGSDGGLEALPPEPRLAPGLDARVDQELAHFDA